MVARGAGGFIGLGLLELEERRVRNTAGDSIGAFGRRKQDGRYVRIRRSTIAELRDNQRLEGFPMLRGGIAIVAGILDIIEITIDNHSATT